MNRRNGDAEQERRNEPVSDVFGPNHDARFIAKVEPSGTWRECMGIEPTRARASGPASILKTETATRPHPLPYYTMTMLPVPGAVTSPICTEPSTAER